MMMRNMMTIIPNLIGFLFLLLCSTFAVLSRSTIKPDFLLIPKIIIYSIIIIIVGVVISSRSKNNKQWILGGIGESCDSVCKMHNNLVCSPEAPGASYGW
jgi:hypothetical protein